MEETPISVRRSAGEAFSVPPFSLAHDDIDDDGCSYDGSDGIEGQ